MTDIDYSILENGFQVTHNDFVDFYYAVSVDCNDDGDYQFCTKEFKDAAERLVDFLNLLLKDKFHLEKENDELKQRNQKLDDKLYFKECDIFDLRKERNSFKERLFYLQNAINDAMEHQKAEIGVNVLKEVIVDYNDWILGHKCGDVE